MNGTTSSVTPSAVAPESRPLDAAQIDVSCRLLVLPVVAGAKWLALSALLGLITSVKLHSPGLLAGSEWLTYGHTFAVARNAFVYGFATQVGLAVALWLLCRLGRTTLAGGLAISIGTVFWNIGVFIGAIGILSGNSTGFEWLEFPRAGSVLMFGAYIVIAVGALLTFSARRTAELYVSQWFILGALLVFPWLYSSAQLLLVYYPVRGVMQTVVAQWFASGLSTLWLGGLVLAILYYFIPKLTAQPLVSRTLALFGFWTLFAFGCWGGLYRGLPLPSWLISASVAGTVLLLVPLVANVVNLWSTLQSAKPAKIPLLGFFRTALIFTALSGVMSIGLAFCSKYSRLSLLADATEILLLYGSVGFALFGAVFYILPRLVGDAASERLVRVTSWSALLGTGLFVVATGVGGMVQNGKLFQGEIPFLDVLNSVKPFIRMSTMGWLLLLVASVAFLMAVLSLARKGCCQCCGGWMAALSRSKGKASRSAR